MNRNQRTLVLSIAAGLALLFAATGRTSADEGKPEKLPEGMQVVGLAAIPATIELKHRYDYAQLLVTGVLATGERIDVTRMAAVEAPAALLAISPNRLVRPAGDGTGALAVSLAGQTLSVPVKVTGQKDDYPISFVRDVMPVVSKLGCNAGTCHGAANGKNGFKLSLRGYDPLFDHRALTDDLAGRRFNRAAPDQSLMLLKPSGGVPHVGGAITHRGEPYYEILRAWIAAGVKLDLETPRVTKIEVFPKEALVPLAGMKQQVVVTATYADGRTRDVTAESFLVSSTTDVVEVDKQGLAIGMRRGEASLLARYEGSYAATTVVVMGDRSGFVWQDAPQNNHLDKLVYDKLKKVKVQPSELCTDAEFIRRVYLDLLGVPPQPDAVRAFIADARDTKVKRDEMIDRLIGSPEYIDHWTNKWADLLQVNRKFLGEEGAWAFRNWIRQALSDNMPYDQFVYRVLTASGSTLANPPASYYKVLRTPADAMENTTQLFLAVRFNCNKCHDHPFERWTQDQYYHLAAYFAHVGRKAAPEFAGRSVGGTAVEQALPLVEVVYDQGAGDVTHERTGKVAGPEFPYAFTGSPEANSPAARREQLARWITSKDNPYFAKSYVNRIWSYLVGVGIIEPIDDIRAGNPPSNPELLDRLTGDFLASGFDVRGVFREICKSRVYQQSIVTNKWNQDDDINFSHALARRLPAETLYDAVHVAAGSRPKLPGVPEGFLASQLPDSGVELADGFLNLFGRPPRESACECERSSGVMLGQALNLVNGPTIAEAISDPKNRITSLVASQPDDGKLVEDLFMSILCRLPKPEESAAGVEAINAAGRDYDERQAALTALERDKLPARQAAWEKSQRPVAWTVLDVAAATSAGGAELTRQPDGAIAASGKSPEADTYTILATTKLEGITAIRIEVLADPSLPSGGPGRAANGNFVLNELRASAAPLANLAAGKAVALGPADADFSQADLAAATAVDGDPKTGWAIAPQFGKPHVAVFEAAEDVGAAGGTALSLVLDQQYGTQHTIGRLRISATAAKRPVKLDGLPPAVLEVLAIAPEKRTAEQQAALAAHYRTQDAEWMRLSAEVERAKQAQSQYRLQGAQDLAWALINSPAFLFNR
ncbi:MAG: DUF1553 domain-containing protein [Planctomycetia bacterium]|nr:DUF1553 domain-containing protein [Planctomycetia bacterium]